MTAAPDTEFRWPDVTVADGRRTLGFLFYEPDGTVTATGPQDEPLGSFPDVESAGRAVLTYTGGVS